MKHIPVEGGFDVPVLYEDNHLLVVRKPAGLLVQGDITGDGTLVEYAKDYIKYNYRKPGNVFLGIVHRLDRPVSGVIVLARTSKAAARLSGQFRQKTMRKTYWAIVQGSVPEKDAMTDWIVRRGVTSEIGDAGTGKLARLSYRRIRQWQKYALVAIDLETGRHHQIRVQFASRGNPILGDFRYGSKISFPQKTIALLGKSITITHPVQKQKMSFETEPDICWKDYIFELADSNLLLSQG